MRCLVGNELPLLIVVKNESTACRLSPTQRLMFTLSHTLVFSLQLLEVTRRATEISGRGEKKAASQKSIHVTEPAEEITLTFVAELSLTYVSADC